MDYGSFTPPVELESTAAILATFDQGLADGIGIIGGMDDATLMTNWSLVKGDISANAERADAVDLRTQQGRESVRLVSSPNKQ
jgi:hypothetical protein